MSDELIAGAEARARYIRDTTKFGNLAYASAADADFLDQLIAELRASTEREKALRDQLLLATGFIAGLSTIVPAHRRDDVAAFGDALRAAALSPEHSHGE